MAYPGRTVNRWTGFSSSCNEGLWLVARFYLMGVPGMMDRAERQWANSLNLIRFEPAEGFEMSEYLACCPCAGPLSRFYCLIVFSETLHGL